MNIPVKVLEFDIICQVQNQQFHIIKSFSAHWTVFFVYSIDIFPSFW